MRTRLIPVAALLTALLAACGGGGDNASAPAAPDREAAAARGGPGGGGGGGGGSPIPGVDAVADAGVRSMTLGWSDNGASQYNVYLSSSPNCDIANYALCPDGRMLVNVRAPLKIDGLVNGRAYYAKVEGVHRKGRSLSREAGAKPTTLEFNGAVYAVASAPDGGTYVGGSFTRVGLTSGQGLLLDTLGGRPLVPGYPVIGPGAVTAAAPDGAGGWFIGGYFGRVGSALRHHVAHLRADGSLNPNWNPQPDNAVNAIAVMNGVVYIGGNFLYVNGQLRGSVAAIDAASGQLMAWNPGPNRGVTSIVAANGNVYIGGTFTQVGGFTRNHLAAIDTAGNVLPWNPNAGDTVTTLALAGSTIYAGGFFQSMAGQQRAMVAALDAAGSGALKPWNPSSQPCSGCEVSALAVANNTVYLGGRFQRIGSATRRALAAVDAAGNVLPWNPGFDGYEVRSLAATFDTTRGATVYVGGDFSAIGGQPRSYAAALDAQGLALTWQPAPNAPVEVVRAAGNAVFAGGRFTGLNAVVRERIAAIDAAGSLKAWNPGVDGIVRALAVQGNTIHVGGAFRAIGGQPRANIARVDAAGNVLAWNPGTDAPVNAMALAPSGTLYIGGEFRHVAGAVFNRLAAFMPSGQFANWTPNADAEVLALAAGPVTANGDTVYIGGRFGFINGQVRRRIAQVEVLNGQAQPTAWNPWGFELVGATDAVHALAYGNGTVYAGGLFARLGPNLAQIGEAGNLMTWAGADSRVWSLALAGNRLYVGGEFGQLFQSGGTPIARNRLGALDVVGRTLTAWDPNVGSPGEAVYAVATGAGAVHAGGMFGHVGGEVVSGFATLAP